MLSLPAAVERGAPADAPEPLRRPGTSWWSVPPRVSYEAFERVRRERSEAVRGGRGSELRDPGKKGGWIDGPAHNEKSTFEHDVQGAPAKEA